MKAWVNGSFCELEPEDILKLQGVTSLQLLGYNDNHISFDVASPKTYQGLFAAKAACRHCRICNKEFAAKRRRDMCCSVACSIIDTRKRLKGNIRCKQIVAEVNEKRLYALAVMRAERLKTGYLKLLSGYPALAEEVEQQLQDVLAAVRATKSANIVTG